jgi:hypothetical protein
MAKGRGALYRLVASALRRPSGFPSIFALAPAARSGKRYTYLLSTPFRWET